LAVIFAARARLSRTSTRVLALPPASSTNRNVLPQLKAEIAPRARMVPSPCSPRPSQVRSLDRFDHCTQTVSYGLSNPGCSGAFGCPSIHRRGTTSEPKGQEINTTARNRDMSRSAKWLWVCRTAPDFEEFVSERRRLLESRGGLT
jgi:hypothetical protein